MLGKNAVSCCPKTFGESSGLSDGVTSMCNSDKQERGSAEVCVRMRLMLSEVARNLCQATLSTERGTLH